MSDKHETQPNEHRWWEMQLGVKVRPGSGEDPAPRAPEKREHRSFHLTRTSDEHRWWEMQLGKNVQKKS